MTQPQYNVSFVPIPTHPRFIDLTNHIYGRLTVLGFAGNHRRRTSWWCQCECGNIKQIPGVDMRSGAIRSCTCLLSETTTQRLTKHGECIGGKDSPEYTAYTGAKDRCTRQTSPSFEDYGGRGIKFLYTSFQEFLDDVGRKPSSAHSIDRIENNGNYEKGNCEWNTPVIQARHTRHNRMITVGEITQCVVEWAETLNIPAQRIYERLCDGNYCDECAVIQPARKSCPHQ